MTLEFRDGTKADLTLNFALVYRLKTENPKAYKQYFRALNSGKGTNDDNFFEMVDIVYAAYLCGRIKEGTSKDAMVYTEFLEALPEDPTLITLMSQALVNPKEAGRLEAHLKTPQASPTKG